MDNEADGAKRKSERPRTDEEVVAEAWGRIDAAIAGRHETGREALRAEVHLAPRKALTWIGWVGVAAAVAKVVGAVVEVVTAVAGLD